MIDPGSAGKRLGPEPMLHETAELRDTTFGAYCEVGARTRIAESTLGDYAYVDRDSDIAHASIGKFCSIASQVRINPGNHPLERVALNHFTYRSSAYGYADGDDMAFFDWRRSHRVTLGPDVWVGHGAIVLPGVGVGAGAAIGAGAVVSRDVPAFAIVVGAPARVTRLRFVPDVVDALTAIAWWDFPHDKLLAAIPDLRKLSAEAFCAKYG